MLTSANIPQPGRKAQPNKALQFSPCSAPGCNGSGPVPVTPPGELCSAWGWQSCCCWGPRPHSSFWSSAVFLPRKLLMLPLSFLTQIPGSFCCRNSLQTHSFQTSPPPELPHAVRGSQLQPTQPTEGALVGALGSTDPHPGVGGPGEPVCPTATPSIAGSRGAELSPHLH